METLLKVEGINVYYGAIHAIKDISFQVNQGEIVTLIGANGAGKTTTLQTVSGLLRSKTGSILFDGQDINTVSADKLVGRGLAQVPEGRRAADAGHGPRPHVPPQAADAGRALHGPGPHPGGADL